MFAARDKDGTLMFSHHRPVRRYGNHWEADGKLYHVSEHAGKLDYFKKLNWKTESMEFEFVRKERP
jgi:hypothetical protein